MPDSPHETRLTARIAKQKRRVERYGGMATKTRARIEKAQKHLRWAIAKRTVHRKALRDARKALASARRHDAQAAPKFQSYMLNGCPGDITPELEDAIARAVLDYDSYVTATTNGTHVTDSFHYPWNNAAHGYSDDLGHAGDFGGPLGTYDKFYIEEKGRGCENYDELFGPGSGYCDNCAYQSGAAPDNPNHTHCAPKHHG